MVSAMNAQKVRTYIRRLYMTLPDRFDLALELFPGAVMTLGGVAIIAIAVS